MVQSKKKKDLTQKRPKRDDLGNFETHEKLTRHIFPSLRPYNFCIKQFFISRVI